MPETTYSSFSEKMINMFSSFSAMAIFWPSVDPDGKRNWKNLCSLPYLVVTCGLRYEEKETWQTIVNIWVLLHLPQAQAL